MRTRPRLWSLALPAVVLLLGGCCRKPTFTPGFWNDGGLVQFHNNCYNYSNNHRTNTFAQPGRRAGAMYTGLSCAAVLAAATADGIPRLPSSGACGRGRDKIALVVGARTSGSRRRPRRGRRRSRSPATALS